MTFRAELVFAGIIVMVHRTGWVISPCANCAARLSWQEGLRPTPIDGFIECIDVGKIYHGRTGDVRPLAAFRSPVRPANSSACWACPAVV